MEKIKKVFPTFDGESIVVNGFKIPLSFPVIEVPSGESHSAEIVYFHPTVKRICPKILANSEIVEGNPKKYRIGKWGLLSFEQRLAITLIGAVKTVRGMKASREFASYIINHRISTLVNSLELLRGPHHYDLHKNVIEMWFPDRSVGQDLFDEIKEEFWNRALEMGCNLTFTSKSSPGDAFLLGDYPDLLKSLWIWPSVVNPKRAPREMFSSIPNAQKYISSRNSQRKVKSVVPLPDSIKERVKYFNCAFFDPEDLIPEGHNTDQILGTGWLIDGSADVSVQESITVPFHSATKSSLEEQYSGKKDLVVELVETKLGDFTKLDWRVTFTQVNSHKMAWKAATLDGVKGMVVPEDVLLVEKRLGENFFRPIYFVIPASSVEKKKAGRLVLQALASRLPESFYKDTEDFEEERARLSAQDYQSEIFILKMYGNSNRVKKIASGLLPAQRVLGFRSHEGRIIPINENSIGEVYADIIPVIGENGILKTLVGEVTILRQQEDETFGEIIRSPEDDNGIKVDPFMVLSKSDLPIDEAVKERVNFLFSLSKILIDGGDYV